MAEFFVWECGAAYLLSGLQRNAGAPEKQKARHQTGGLGRNCLQEQYSMLVKFFLASAISARKVALECGGQP